MIAVNGEFKLREGAEADFERALPRDNILSRHHIGVGEVERGYERGVPEECDPTRSIR